MPDPTLTQLDDRELENQTVDTSNFPYQKQRAMLNWSPTANSGAGGWTKFGKLIAETYDYIGFTYPAADTTVMTFKTGGSGGTTVATLTLVYTSAAKEALSSVTKA